MHRAPWCFRRCSHAFRTLVGKPIPLNSGCLDPIEVIIPEGSMLAPQPPAAVVGGNVETSQRISARRSMARWVCLREVRVR